MWNPLKETYPFLLYKEKEINKIPKKVSNNFDLFEYFECCLLSDNKKLNDVIYDTQTTYLLFDQQIFFQNIIFHIALFQH